MAFTLCQAFFQAEDTHGVHWKPIGEIVVYFEIQSWYYQLLNIDQNQDITSHHDDQVYQNCLVPIHSGLLFGTGSRIRWLPECEKRI